MSRLGDPVKDAFENKGRKNCIDQYSDGVAAEVWELCIGDEKSRTGTYKDFLINLLREKRCKRILDAACGTGTDSIMLLEAGFDVVSVDLSEHFLRFTREKRWKRRKEPAFDNWVIEQANWLSLAEDLRDKIDEGFDAIICIGNSFSHLTDSDGDKREQKQALRNFEKCLKPGGLLLIDHRNFDNILHSGAAPVQSIYYNSDYLKTIKPFIVYSNGKPVQVIMDYLVRYNNANYEFRFFYYPHSKEEFTSLLRETFSEKAKLETFGDFKPLDQIQNPGYFIYVVEKTKDLITNGN